MDATNTNRKPWSGRWRVLSCKHPQGQDMFPLRQPLPFLCVVQCHFDVWVTTILMQGQTGRVFSVLRVFRSVLKKSWVVAGSVQVGVLKYLNRYFWAPYLRLGFSGYYGYFRYSLFLEVVSQLIWSLMPEIPSDVRAHPIFRATQNIECTQNVGYTQNIG